MVHYKYFKEFITHGTHDVNSTVTFNGGLR